MHAVGLTTNQDKPTIVLMDKRNASRTTSSRSLKNATFHLTGCRFLHPTKLPGDLPVTLKCHILTLNMIELLLSDAVIDTSMPQCHVHFKVLLTSVHFVAVNVTHALASSVTVRLTFNDDDVVIRNGWTPEEEKLVLYICALKHCVFMKGLCVFQ